MGSGRKAPKPCGPQDRRLRISRCACCRRARTGCDGNRPCMRCKSRGIRCVEAEQLRSRHVVILASYNASKNNSELVSSANTLSTLPGDVLETFFSLVGNISSPFARAFDRRLIEASLATSEPIRAAIRAIAKVAQSPSHVVGANIACCPDEVKTERSRLSLYLHNLLPRPGQTICQDALLFICLFAMYELMMDATGSNFVALVKQASVHLQSHRSPGFSAPFPNKYLALVYELFETITRLILDEDTYLADAALNEDSYHEDVGDLQDTLDADFQLLRTYCKFLAGLARVSAKAVQWEAEAHAAVGKMDHAPDKEQCTDILESKGLLKSGLSIIDAGKTASIIHSQIMPIRTEQEGNDPTRFTSLQPVLHSYGMVRLARLFKDPLWNLVCEHVPAVEHIPNLEGLVSASLGLLEKRLPYVGFESIFILHFLPRMALEVHCAEDRDLMLSIMRSILTKGFAVTAAYISDVEMTWQFGDQLRLSRENTNLSEI